MLWTDTEMIRYLKIFILFQLWLCFQSHPILACRYNVRETGFVDQGTRPYFFYGYINSNTEKEIIQKFKQISHKVLYDCNIQVEIIDVDLQKDHPALEYIPETQMQSFPFAVLVSPNGQSLQVDITKENEPFEKSLNSALNYIIFSPVREIIIKNVIETYGVILLIEGENEQANENYRAIASSAIESIKSQMKFMVKYIKHPPVLISLKRESLFNEKILLWSLGMEENSKDSYAAIFYGKARWIGPLMKNDEIHKENLIRILSVIGLDCECGTDISWVGGTILPVKWDQKRQTQVAELLGFDPENPLVIFEVTRILKMGSSSYPDVPVVIPDTNKKYDWASEGYIIDKPKSHLKRTFFVFVGFVIVIAISAAIILIRAKKRTF